jgi:hypothetical protein
MPGRAGQLTEEGALGAAVALTERVQVVDLGEQPGQPVDERGAGPAAQPVEAGERAEDLVGVADQALRRAEQRALADRDRAQLAGPGAGVAEDEPVEYLQVGEVVVAGQRGLSELGQPVRGEVGLCRGQLGSIDDAEPIAEDSRLEIEVGIPAHRR